MQNHPTLPNITNFPTISTVSVVTVSTAKQLIASGDLTPNGAKKLFDPVIWPQLEPGIERIPFDREKDQCFRDCVAYLMAEATALRSERRHTDALQHIEVGLTLEALIYGGHAEFMNVCQH